uniref:Integrase core domain containing protein n=1 Tax=Solanum tuberosum TaxID=4113 RepID=M1DXV8_SOLTU
MIVAATAAVTWLLGGSVMATSKRKKKGGGVMAHKEEDKLFLKKSMSSGGDGARHREHLGVSQTKQAKKKKSRRPIDPEDIAGSISSAPERINHDTHLFAVPFGTSPQLSAMRLGDSSTEQSDAMAGTPPLTQNFVHPYVSPSSTTTPSATPHDTMSALAPGQKDRLGRVMIEPDGSSLLLYSDQIAKLTAALAESERKRVAEQQSMSETVQQIKEQVMNLALRPTTSAPDDTDDESDEDDYVDLPP